jgi:hypothetical protein
VPVKPETVRGARKLLPRRKRNGARPSDAAGRALAGTEPAGPGGSRAGSADPEFDPVEFAEFLEADPGPLPIDPGFRERLREQLWEIVREAAGNPRPDHRRPRRSS